MTLLMGGLAALAGLALGSYAVTAGVRAARFESVTRGRSRCDHCHAALRYRQTLPILSFLWAKGRCHACQTAIDPIHLVGEVGGALVVVLAFTWTDGLRSPLIALIGLALIAASACDWKAMRLPDPLTATIAAAGLALSLLRSLEDALIGLVAAAVLASGLLLLRLARERSGRDPGLGFGDVKLIAALALWLGLAAPWMLMLSAVLGLGLWRLGREPVIPFGPAIALAGWGLGLATEIGLWSTIA